MPPPEDSHHIRDFGYFTYGVLFLLTGSRFFFDRATSGYFRLFAAICVILGLVILATAPRYLWQFPSLCTSMMTWGGFLALYAHPRRHDGRERRMELPPYRAHEWIVCSDCRGHPGRSGICSEEALFSFEAVRSNQSLGLAHPANTTGEKRCPCFRSRLRLSRYRRPAGVLRSRPTPSH